MINIKYEMNLNEQLSGKCQSNSLSNKLVKFKILPRK